MQRQFIHFVEGDIATLERRVDVTQDRIGSVLESDTGHGDESAFLHAKARSEPHLAEDEVQDSRALKRVVAQGGVGQAVDVLKRSLTDRESRFGIAGCRQRQ